VGSLCNSFTNIVQISSKALESSTKAVESAELKEFAMKDKEIPVKDWTGPEDSRRLRLPDFKTIGTLTL